MEACDHVTAEKSKDSGKDVPSPSSSRERGRGRHAAAHGHHVSVRTASVVDRKPSGPPMGPSLSLPSARSDSEGGCETPEFTFGTTNQLRMPDLSKVPKPKDSPSSQLRCPRSESVPEFSFGTTNQLRLPDVSHLPLREPSPRMPPPDSPGVPEFTFGTTNQLRMPDLSHVPKGEPYTFGTTNQLRMPDLSHVPKVEPSPRPRALHGEDLRAAGQAFHDELNDAVPANTSMPESSSLEHLSAPSPSVAAAARQQQQQQPHSAVMRNASPDGHQYSGGSGATPSSRSKMDFESNDMWNGPITHLPGTLIPAMPPTPQAAAAPPAYSNLPHLSPLQVHGWQVGAHPALLDSHSAPRPVSAMVQTPCHAGQVVSREPPSGSVSEISWTNAENGHHQADGSAESQLHAYGQEDLQNLDPVHSGMAWGDYPYDHEFDHNYDDDQYGQWYDLEPGDDLNYAAVAGQASRSVRRDAKANRLAHSLDQYGSPGGVRRIAVACLLLWFLIMAAAVVFFLVQAGALDMLL